MFIDFSTVDKASFEADICIIGAGAAGFSSAVTLMNSGLKILVVEGGGHGVNARAQALHTAILSGHPHSGIHEARARIIGGTTTKWGGQALPFMKEDFEGRPHVELSGWPVTLDDLKPYYKEAETILGTDHSVPFNYNPWKRSNITNAAFLNQGLKLFVTKWCKVPNFADQHSDKIESGSNISLLYNANVVEVLPTDDFGSVKSLRIRALNKKEGTIKARFFIAAGGALETVRLFLASKKFGAAGLGNSSGLAGCYFQDHVAATVGEVLPTSAKKFHDIFDPFYKDGFKYLPRIKLTPLYAAKQQALHASAQILFAGDNTVITDIKNILSAVKNKKAPALRILWSALAPLKLAGVIKTLWRWKINKRGPSAGKGPIWLEVHSEQNPLRESRVSLSETVDELDVPKICLHWIISDMTIETIRKTALLVKSEFESTNIGKVILEPWVEDGAVNPSCLLTDVYHQCGGLKMAASDKDGVVDSSCKVYGINNLYVASSAVFPTSSFSNPTMTIIALSIRICRTIEERIKKENLLFSGMKIFKHEKDVA